MWEVGVFVLCFRLWLKSVLKIELFGFAALNVSAGMKFLEVELVWMLFPSLLLHFVKINSLSKCLQRSRCKCLHPSSWEAQNHASLFEVCVSVFCSDSVRKNSQACPSFLSYCTYQQVTTSSVQLNSFQHSLVLTRRSVSGQCSVFL